jgi:ribonuclease HI
MENWKTNGWLTKEGKEVENRDLWEALDAAKSKLGPRLSWHYVPGHAGVPGNERCDAIAVAFSKGENPALFSGSRVSYGIDLDQLESGSPYAPKQAPIYLSYVNGTIYRDSEWKSCERRIRGVRGAKYKKVKSEAEVAQLLRQWGVEKA